jgi:hypothetical protein
MRKLPRRVRLQRALDEAEAHVRKFGLADLDDWAYSYAFHWGFEDDQTVDLVAEHMKRTHEADQKRRAAAAQQEEDEAYERWKVLRERDSQAASEPAGKIDWGGVKRLGGLLKPSQRRYEQRWQQEQSKKQRDSS